MRPWALGAAEDAGEHAGEEEPPLFNVSAGRIAPDPNTIPTATGTPTPTLTPAPTYRHWEHKEPFEVALEKEWRLEARLRAAGRPGTKRRPATRG